MKHVALAAACLLVVAGPVRGAVLLQDNFEPNTTKIGAPWKPWAGPTATGFQQVLLSHDSVNHTPGGQVGVLDENGNATLSGTDWAAPFSPYGSNAYTDLGTQTGGVHFEAWQYMGNSEPYNSANNPQNPASDGDVQNWPVAEHVSLLGNVLNPPTTPIFDSNPSKLPPYDSNPLGTDNNLRDFVQMGVDPSWAGGYTDLSVRTAFMQINQVGTMTSGSTYAFNGQVLYQPGGNLQTIASRNPDGSSTTAWTDYSVDTGISRASVANQWIKYSIDVDPMSAGGQIRMSIWNDSGQQLWSGTSQRVSPYSVTDVNTNQVINVSSDFRYAFMGRNLPDYQGAFYDDVLATTLLPGDFNNDGFVGQSDLNLVLAHWGQTVTSGDHSLGDWNADGFVGQSDLNFVLANWGQGVPLMTVVPEPSSMVLAGLAMVGFCGCVLRSRKYRAARVVR